MNDKTKDPTGDSSATSSADAIEARVVALAEQFGRLVGTVQARADGLVDRQALNEQLTRIRDGATGLLGHLAGQKPSAARRSPKRSAKAKPAPRAAVKTAGRSGGKVDAPGKATPQSAAPWAERQAFGSDDFQAGGRAPDPPPAAGLIRATAP